MKHAKDALEKSALDTHAASAAAAAAFIRNSVASVLPKAVVTPAAPTAQENIGEFRLVPISGIEVPDRFRRDLGDIAGLAQSIAEVGLLQPILLTPEQRLVSGMRRLKAHELLQHEQILARILDVEDESLASIEEDRARKPLTATEKYAITDLLREKMRDEAWRRRALGGKLEKAIQRGRVDDLLGKHVGISRPTLLKIRSVVEAARTNPERYSKIAEALDRDGKVDRHYKSYLTELGKTNPTSKFRVILLNSSWQTLETAVLRKATKAADLQNFAEDDSILLIPSSIANLSQASSLASLTKFGWVTTLMGNQDDSEKLWLVATLGKSLPQEETLGFLSEACVNGYTEVYDAATILSEGSILPIDISHLAAGGA
jgi:ParB-like chromosome segregation protein Spo0J